MYFLCRYALVANVVYLMGYVNKSMGLRVSEGKERCIPRSAHILIVPHSRFPSYCHSMRRTDHSWWSHQLRCHVHSCRLYRHLWQDRNSQFVMLDTHLLIRNAEAFPAILGARTVSVVRNSRIVIAVFAIIGTTTLVAAIVRT